MDTVDIGRNGMMLGSGWNEDTQEYLPHHLRAAAVAELFSALEGGVIKHGVLQSYSLLSRSEVEMSASTGMVSVHSDVAQQADWCERGRERDEDR